MAHDVRFELRVSDALMERVDAARGEDSRATFVRSATERALNRPAPAALEDLRRALAEAQMRKAPLCERILAAAIKRAET